eukprot:7021607-Lingulodinium_polyedra.AAC.1
MRGEPRRARTARAWSERDAFVRAQRDRRVPSRGFRCSNSAWRAVAAFCARQDDAAASCPAI